MLSTIRFDVLKLDKSLVDFVGDPEGEKLISSTVELAKSLGMKITAEGVETAEQVEFLNRLDCDEIQGYYFSKPLPLEEYSALLQS
jgi:EAL domain-containing protein (putative c-di-GMP-specific phosphodiesterase class I)